tara:strand:- start:1862 stop:2725 length:864 start_codon:yes stop_codon:yes gene_type:complete
MLINTTLDGLLKNMPLHQNFYLRGILNSFIPAFMGGTDRVLTEDALSGEAVEMLRTLVKDIAGDMLNGYSTSITYDDINKKYNLENVFKQEGMDLSGFENQVKMALGGFIVEKKNNKIIIHDDYDFPPPGSWKMYSNLKDFGDYVEASSEDISKAPYFASRFLAERFMAEGDEKNFAIRIELPEEEQVVNIDYDDDIPAGAQNYVFRGAMTNKRKSIWDKFMSMFVSPAEAQSNDNTDATDLTDLKNVRIMQLKGRQPFPMDGDDEYGRMNDAQRRIADTDLSDLDG